MLFGPNAGMNKWIKVLALTILLPHILHAQRRSNADLKRIYFNLYTDSIKTVMHYYVNVEGEYGDGRVLPLDTTAIVLSADNGSMQGNDWVPPANIHFEKVRFRASVKGRPELHEEVTVWLKRGKDPADETEEMDLPDLSRDRRGRRR